MKCYQKAKAVHLGVEREEVFKLFVLKPFGMPVFPLKVITGRDPSGYRSPQWNFPEVRVYKKKHKEK